MVILLQVDPGREGEPSPTRLVQARVVRSTPRGFGVQFLFPDKARQREFHRFLRDHLALDPGGGPRATPPEAQVTGSRTEGR